MNQKQVIDYLKSFYVKAEEVDPGFAINLTHLRNKFVLLEYLRIVNDICDLLVKEAKVLDWGCGIGHMMYLLHSNKTDIDIYGYDVNYGNYKKANDCNWQLFLKDVGMLNKIKYGMDPVQLPYVNNDFDAVLSIGVLEHVSYPLKSIMEIQRILRPQGYFFIYELPNFYSYGEYIRKKLNKSHHLVKFKKKELVNEMNNRGFKVISARYASLLPRRLKHWERLVPFIDRYAKQLDYVDGVLTKIYPINRLCQSIELVAQKL